MRNVGVSFLACYMALTSDPAEAGRLYPVDPNVSTVRSGGYWEQAGSRGTYRVVVARYGSEHVSSHIRLEWVTDDQKIAKTEVLHDALLGSIDIESMRWNQAGTRVVLAGELRDGSKYRCEVQLKKNGEYSKAAGC